MTIQEQAEEQVTKIRGNIDKMAQRDRTEQLLHVLLTRVFVIEYSLEELRKNLGY